MELKDFIKNVLKEVVEAVEETRGESMRDMHLDSVPDRRTVEFDIAVTAEDSVGSSGRAGIKVFSFIEGGGDVSSQVKNSSVSRIQFGVHVDRWTKEENRPVAAQFTPRHNPGR